NTSHEGTCTVCKQAVVKLHDFTGGGLCVHCNTGQGVIACPLNFSYVVNHYEGLIGFTWKSGATDFTGLTAECRYGGGLVSPSQTLTADGGSAAIVTFENAVPSNAEVVVRIMKNGSAIAEQKFTLPPQTP
ncbi:MAG: hypothetical protein RSB55_08935, partial [Oscillospiraceae bacterium]